MIVLWSVAILFTFYTTITTIRANFTTGIVLLWIISAALLCFAAFHEKICRFSTHGFGKALKVVFLAGIVLYGYLFVFVALSGYRHTAKGDEQAIIILGAGLHGERVSEVLRLRLEAGYEVWEENQDALVVVSGGQGTQEAIPEALAMQRWLIDKGVPEDKILIEDKSTSTQENLVFSRDLLKKYDIGQDEPIGIVTNAFHCYRAEQYAKKAGFTDPRMVPASMNAFSVLPSYLREVLAVLDLWIFK